jgi:tetratricopeptide (TPR) repeat protein
MSFRSRRRTGLPFAAALIAACLAVGCKNVPRQPPPSAQPSSAVAPAPTAVAAPAEASAPPEPATASSPVLGAQAISRTVMAAIEQLEQGQEEQAEAALRQVLQAEPNHRLALQLLRQIKDDPVALLGRESFPYKVQAGESLSRIAQRFLNDSYLFYALARYNGIKVPRQLAGGQMIRVPGKAPPPAASGAPPVPAATATPAAAPAAASAPAPAQAPEPATAASRAEREKAGAIARYTREARSAFAKQDLAAAIRGWDKVLALDPNHRTALLERQKAVDLSERLKKVR